MKLQLVAAMAAAGIAMAGIGCESNPSKVNKDELKAVERAGADVRVGSTRKEVEDAFKKGSFTRLGETMVGGAQISEWRLEAYVDDDWNRTRDQYIKFYYFMNDVLVDISNQRINFRDPGVVANWKTNFEKLSSEE